MTLFEKFDIDRRQLITLFTVYFKLDFRSSKSVLQQSKREYVTSNSAVLSLLGLYLITGLFLSFAAFISTALIFSVITLSYTFFIVALTIIAESGNVIFNEAEADIIGHLPVNSRTLFAAKVLNLFSFTALLAIAVNLFPSLLGIWAKDSNVMFSIGHLLAALAVALFSTSLVITGYGLLIRYVDKERFNNIIAYSQAALTIVFILGYQLLPRLMETGEGALQNANPTYFLFYPPAWFSGIAMIVIGNWNWLSVGLAALALLALGLVTGLALRKVSVGYAGFASRLASDSGDGKRRAGRRAKDGAPLSPAIGRVKTFLLRNSVERAIFDLVSTYLKRDREVKVRFYPTFAYLLMFPIIGLFSAGLPDPFTDLDQKSIFQTLAGAAMIPFIAMSAVETIMFSEHYPAAYLFRVTPIHKLGDLHGGVRKAILVYVAAPGAAALVVFFTVLWQHPGHALLIVLPWLILTPLMMLIPFFRRERLPLARKYQKGQQTARSIFLMLGIFFIFFLIGTLQSLSLSGPSAYLIFLAAILFFSSILYILLRRFSGESAPIPPTTDGSEG